MTRDEALQALDEVAQAMAAQHPGQPERLHQLTSHLSTAAMAVNHLFDHADSFAAQKEG